MPKIDFTLQNQQGPIPANFRVQLEGRYIVLVGPNNVAKTSVLTAIFRQYYQQLDEQGRSKICFILPERIFVDLTSQPQGYTLEQYNSQLAQSIGNSNKNYYGITVGV